MPTTVLNATINPEPPPTGNLEIVLERSNMMIAPEVIKAHVLVKSGFQYTEPATLTEVNSAKHLLQFRWVVVGSTMQYRSDRLTPKMRDATEMRGKEVAHLFVEGSYTLGVYVNDPATGFNDYTEVQFTVGATEAAFGASEINYIDPDDDFANAPLGARTFNSLQTFLDNFKDGDYSNPQLVYLNKGKTFPFQNFRPQDSQRPSLYITSDPRATGAKPILSQTSAANTAFYLDSGTDPALTMDVVFYDLDLRGLWDPETETGGSSVCVLPRTSGPRYVSMVQCDTSGWGITMRCDGGRRVHMANNLIDGWQDYGLFGNSFNHIVLIGNIFRQKVLALQGPKDDIKHNNHGCFRATATRLIIALGNDFFSSNGWTSSFSTRAGYFVQQPCMRIWTNGSSTSYNDGGLANIDGNIFEGADAISQAGSGVGNSMRVNVTITNNIQVADMWCRQFLGSTAGGITLRNNRSIAPDIPRVNGDWSYRRFAQFDYTDDKTDQPIIPETKNMPNRVEGNSSIRLCTTAVTGGQADIDIEWIDNNGGYTANIAQANFEHRPNSNTPNAPYTNIEDTGNIFNMLHNGYTTRYRRYVSSYAAENGGDLLDGQSMTIPYGSIAAGLTRAAVNETPEAGMPHQLESGSNPGNNGQLSDVAITFDAANVIVTNNRGSALSGSFVLHLLTDDDAFITTESQYDAAGKPVPGGQPLIGSTNNAVSAALAGWDDANGVTRPGSHSVGALEALT